MTDPARPPQLPPRSRYAWWVIVMLWFVCFFNYADRQAISSVFPILKREFQFNPTQLGWIGSAFMWVYAFGAPLAGLAADRFRRKNLILGGCVIWSFFTLATAWCGRLPAFLAVRALTGVGETFYFPSSMSLISDYHSKRTRSRAMAWHQSAVYAGTILGSWMAASLAEQYGWRLPFYCFGPIGIILALVLWRWLREPARGAADDRPAAAAAAVSLSLGETLAAIFRSPAAPLLMAAFLGANFVATIFMTWTPTFLVEKFHYSLGAAGLTGTVYIHLGSAVAVPLAGALADYLARRFVAGRMLVQWVGLVVGAGFVFLVGTVSDRGALVAAMAVFGVGKGFYDSGIFASLYDTIEPRARGSAAGLMNTVGWGGGALGPLFVGYATQYGKKATAWENMSDAIAWCGAIYLVAAALIALAMILVSRQPRPRPVAA
jgi:MFS family permease